MKKVITLIISAILLCLYFLMGEEGRELKEVPQQIKYGAVIGKEHAASRILFVSKSEQALDQTLSLKFLKGLTTTLEKEVDSAKVSIENVTVASLLNKVKSGEDFSGSLVIFPDRFYLDKNVAQSLHDKSITTVFFSSLGQGTCIGNIQSPYLWNFGITPSMYAESYLSFINQKFAILARDLTFVLYSNLGKEGEEEMTYFDKVIKGLGFKVLASVKVDEREMDLYKVLREVINFSPQILFSNVSSRGASPFFSQTHKLGFGFEMGQILSEPVPEELVVENLPASNNYIKPSVYVDSYQGEGMKDFKEIFSKDGLVSSAALYRGHILGEILKKIFVNSKTESSKINFSKELLSLDGTSIKGPSGAVMLHSRARGLIQPLHVGQFKEGRFEYLGYLGDMSPPEECR